MDNTVSKLQEAANHLPRDERKRLGELVMEWEDKYGKQPNQAPTPTLPVSSVASEPPYGPPEPVIMQPAAPVGAEQTQPRPAPAPFGTRFLDPSKLSSMVRPLNQLCPHCGKGTPRNLSNCQSCGRPLQVKPLPTTRRLEETLPKKPTLDPAAFFPNSTLIISIRGAKEILEAVPREQLIIGRNGPGVAPVNLDLGPYNGETLGVSRHHAELRVQSSTLTLTDLESDNGTYINEQRLYAHEVRVIRNGDELRFGKLVMKIAFRH